jgi:hypothetical protein
MIKIKSKHDQMKVSPDGVANNRGDPPRLLTTRGDPSSNSGSGGKRAPTMVRDAMPGSNSKALLKSGQGQCPGRKCCTEPGVYPLLPIKNRDRLSALPFDPPIGGLAPKFEGSGAAVQYYEKESNSERGCVRLEYCPEGFLFDFQNVGTSRGREGFHRAPTTVATEMLWRTTAKEAVQYYEKEYDSERGCVRLEYFPEVSLTEFQNIGTNRGSEGFHRAPTMVTTEMLWRTTAKEAVQYCEKESNSERGCVRLEYCPEVSLTEFQNIGTNRGSEGFHRAPTMGQQKCWDEQPRKKWFNIMKRNIIIERENVRLDDPPDVSLADFSCEEVSRDNDGSNIKFGT